MKLGKFIWWMIKSIIAGLLIILIFNLIGSYIDIIIPFNIWTIIIVSLLKLPGLFIIIIYLFL